MNTIYDTVIVGAGPAGLSAAVYMARFNRTVIVIDKEEGRSSYSQINENYLGFPNGVTAHELNKLGKKQAIRFGATFVLDEVEHIKKRENVFFVEGLKETYEGRTLILATGVTDKFPAIKGIHDYIGKSIFWCITCDGYKTNGKKVTVIGKDNEAASTCLQFLNYTKSLTFITNCEENQVEINKKYLERFKKNKIRWICGKVEGLVGKNGFIKKVILEGGAEVETEMVFSMQGAVPNSYLAKHLHIAVDEKGYIKTDLEQRTNMPFIYAAGDVTRNFSHQVATAVHEGSMAAQSANYDLYSPDQQMIKGL